MEPSLAGTEATALPRCSSIRTANVVSFIGHRRERRCVRRDGTSDGFYSARRLVERDILHNSAAQHQPGDYIRDYRFRRTGDSTEHVYRDQGCEPGSRQTPASGTIWSSAPSFASGLMPTQLGGVSVTVNSKPAFIYFYCSAATDPACTQDQLNILTPLDNTIGPVSVVVTNGALASPPFTVNIQASRPSFFVFGTQVHCGDTCERHSTGSREPYPGDIRRLPSPGNRSLCTRLASGCRRLSPVNGSAWQSGSLPVIPVCTVGGYRDNYSLRRIDQPRALPVESHHSRQDSQRR